MFAFSSTLIVYNVSGDSFCTTCCIFSFEIALQFTQVYSHTNLFEYMNFLKNIYHEECFVMQTEVIWKIFYKEI